MLDAVACKNNLFKEGEVATTVGKLDAEVAVKVELVACEPATVLECCGKRLVYWFSELTLPCLEIDVK